MGSSQIVNHKSLIHPTCLTTVRSSVESEGSRPLRDVSDTPTYLSFLTFGMLLPSLAAYQ